ncbi:hypothetical protein [Desertimonas flava]|uniref:hypothetical protein n=2 Tax=Desertimonas flava TaxID=2064846 RepID=UPI00196942D8|nr:hypothetical protein [Desertimonas flava]
MSRSFRDRFFTPKVAEAMMSPLGIVLAGAGMAAGVVAGAPIALAAGIGALAWGGRVAAAIPRDSTERVQPERLSEPWRGYAQGAQNAKQRFDQVVADVSPGPLRDRLLRLSARLDDGIGESWRIARRGHDIVAAIGKIDTQSAAAELHELRRSGAVDTPAGAQTAKALEAQLASAERLVALADRSRDRLRLLDARFDELIARTVEVSVGTGDSAGLGEDVDELVNELESLRVAMEETAQAGGESTPAAGV